MTGKLGGRPRDSELSPITEAFRDGVRVYFDKHSGERKRITLKLGWTEGQMGKFLARPPKPQVKRAKHQDLLDLSYETKVPLPQNVLDRIYAQLDSTLEQMKPLYRDNEVNRATTQLDGFRNRLNTLARRRDEIDSTIRQLLEERARNEKESAEVAHKLARGLDASAATFNDALLRLAGSTGSEALLRAVDAVKRVRPKD